MPLRNTWELSFIEIALIFCLSLANIRVTMVKFLNILLVLFKNHRKRECYNVNFPDIHLTTNVSS